MASAAERRRSTVDAVVARHARPSAPACGRATGSSRSTAPACEATHISDAIGDSGGRPLALTVERDGGEVDAASDGAGS